MIEQLYQKYLSAGQKISTDTRHIERGSLFFALKGNHFNANEFAQEAIEKGACFAVIDDDRYAVKGKTITVENVLTTLQQLALFHRKKLQTLIIAITGSNGKTTTKELIKSVLSQSFYVQATQGNLNNHIGVALTLLSLKSSTDIAIVEMGANHFGEIALLCKIALPDYGYITSFGKAHLEGFGGIEGVINAKSELYAYLKENKKTIFYNTQDPIQQKLLLGYDHLFSFGKSSDANVVLNEVSSKGRVAVSDVQKNEFVSSLIGAYNVSNISAAVAIGRYFRLSTEAIQRGISEYIPTNNRSQVVETEKNTIIMDAYNANPTSMRAAIDNMILLEADNKVLILGDMRELGQFSLSEHQSIVDFISGFNWKEVFLVGEEFSKVKTNYPKFLTTENLKSFLKDNVLSNRNILVKGSRGMFLEKIFDML